MDGWMNGWSGDRLNGWKGILPVLAISVFQIRIHSLYLFLNGFEMADSDIFEQNCNVGYLGHFQTEIQSSNNNPLSLYIKYINKQDKRSKTCTNEGKEKDY